MSSGSEAYKFLRRRLVELTHWPYEKRILQVLGLADVYEETGNKLSPSGLSITIKELSSVLSKNLIISDHNSASPDLLSRSSID